MTEKIESTAEAWESGDLGQDEEFVKMASLSEEDFNDSLGLKMISIRLEKSLIKDLKLFAELHETGYQPLIKMVLKRWVDGEKKAIANVEIAEQVRETKKRKAMERIEKDREEIEHKKSA